VMIMKTTPGKLTARKTNETPLFSRGHTARAVSAVRKTNSREEKLMLRRCVYVLRCLQLFVLVLVVCAVTSRAQTTSFTDQGKLSDGGGPATGSYDFQFTLWDALSGGTQQPQPSPVTVTKTNVAVSGGSLPSNWTSALARFQEPTVFWKPACDWRVVVPSRSSHRGSQSVQRLTLYAHGVRRAAMRYRARA